MFKNLLNFSYKRNALEAVGFYVAYLIVIMLVSLISAAVLGLITGNENNFQFGVRIGNVVAILTSLTLSFLILKRRNLLSEFRYLLTLLISGVLAFFGGGVFGLIPVSFLSTRQRSK